ncbi:uncharacterized protein METZ01_LOCUS184903 [marine metagenome]|uniref:Uncharacterized protein n=1 Tax=marine metagenome TaxID=408172 RepID=A0A382D1R2_9ZZZZ
MFNQGTNKVLLPPGNTLMNQQDKMLCKLQVLLSY